MQTQVVDAAGHASASPPHGAHRHDRAHEPDADARPGWRDGDYAVMVVGADGGSGLDEVEWSIDGGPFTRGTSPLQATVTGTARTR